ncbi:MAG: DUF5076 domain-containing protein [Phycisphaerales bacterium]|nr:DUF5076 domain-containing protein [Phycisphaerales bacterium]
MAHVNELEAPPSAAQDADAVEISRVWVSEGGLEVSLRLGVFEDPAAWGVLLADLARHVAHAHQQLDGSDAEQTLGLIRDALEAELSDPTGAPTGNLFDVDSDDDELDEDEDEDDDGDPDAGPRRSR